MIERNADAYFIQLCRQIATRATCPKKSVGAAIVRGGRVLSTGYNGALSGEDHCVDVGCLFVPSRGKHCMRAVHAEMNAVAQAARHGVSVEGAVCYTTHRPCRPCYLALRAAGVVRVIYEHACGDEYEQVFMTGVEPFLGETET